MSPNVLRRASLVISPFVMILAACAPDQPTTAPEFTQPTPPASSTSARMRVEGYTKRGEVRSGWVIGRNGQPMALKYEVHDGRAIWQGDIDLGPVSEISTTAADAKPYLLPDPDYSARVGAPVGGPARGVIPNDVGFRWPGGVVPYVIDAGLASKERVAAAIVMIETTTGGVRIVPRNGEADYVKLVNDNDGCTSPIGRRGGEQLIKLKSDCDAGSTAHEFLHSLGMAHEMSRCDRDNFVEIQFDNIADSLRHNFEIACDGWSDISTYDFGSLMHYPLYAFARDETKPTIKLRPGQSYSGVIGQRNGLSLSDATTINHMYGLNNKTPVARICALTGSYLEGTLLTLDGTCSTDEDDTVLSYDWNFGDGVCAGDSGLQCLLAKPTHTYAQDGVYKLGLTVHDGYALGSTEGSITVRNVAPQFTLPSVFPPDEGELFRQFVSFDDPGADRWTATANYGDGSGPQSPELIGPNVLLDHIYVDNSPPGQQFTISLAISDDDETTTKTLRTEVRNVRPTVSAGNDVVLESGQSFNLSASFSDPGVLDAPWQWSINWGTGSPSTGSISTQDKIAVSRQMCASGTYNVVVSVTDKDGGTGTDQVAVTVGVVTAGTDILPGGTPNAVSLKKRGSLPVAVLSSATFDATTIDVASVRLGDDAGTGTSAEKQKGRYVTRVEDVNGDGRLDLVVSFNVQDLMNNGDLNASTTALVIRGFQGTGSCVNFRGTDAVVVVS